MDKSEDINKRKYLQSSNYIVTPYEKVISILNNISDKLVSINEKTLYKELEFVIKTIESKALYSLTAEFITNKINNFNLDELKAKNISRLSFKDSNSNFNTNELTSNYSLIKKETNNEGRRNTIDNYNSENNK